MVRFRPIATEPELGMCRSHAASGHHRQARVPRGAGRIVGVSAGLEPQDAGARGHRLPCHRGRLVWWPEDIDDVNRLADLVERCSHGFAEELTAARVDGDDPVILIVQIAGI